MDSLLSAEYPIKIKIMISHDGQFAQCRVSHQNQNNDKPRWAGSLLDAEHPIIRRRLRFRENVACAGLWTLWKDPWIKPFIYLCSPKLSACLRLTAHCSMTVAMLFFQVLYCRVNCSRARLKTQMVYLTWASAHINIHNTVHKNNVHISLEMH